MNKEILVNENFKLVLEAGDLNYQVYQFDKGGNEVRVVGTGVFKITEEKWKPTGNYFGTGKIDHALVYIAQRNTLLKLPEIADLSEYIDAYRKEKEAILSLLN